MMFQKKRFSPLHPPALPRAAAQVNMATEEINALRLASLSEMVCRTIAQVGHDRRNNLPFKHPENWHRLDMTFGPLHKWLDNFEATGEYDVADDLAIIRPNPKSGEAYPLVDALVAVADTFELIAQDLQIEDNSAPLKHLANLIAVDGEIFDRHIAASRLTLSWMRDVAKNITPTQYADYAVVIQTRATLAIAKKC